MKTVYLKKTGEKWYLVGKNKRGYTIQDEYGTGFYDMPKSEFKKPRLRTDKVEQHILKKYIKGGRK